MNTERAVTTKSNVIIEEMARMLYRDYGPYAYRKFVENNPNGRLPKMENAIKNWEAKNAA
jgi:hypothetical protein